jgi:hypothetical protein
MKEKLSFCGYVTCVWVRIQLKAWTPFRIQNNGYYLSLLSGRTCGLLCVTRTRRKTLPARELPNLLGKEHGCPFFPYPVPGLRIRIGGNLHFLRNTFTREKNTNKT